MNEFVINTKYIKVPSWYMDIRYNGKVIPNGQKHNMLENGANCQVFAYALLRLNDKVVPDLRSKELWEDQGLSETVKTFEPLDILFFKKDDNPWGAHVGVYIGNDQVIHLAKKQEYPVIWDLDKFQEFDEYKVLIGGKRFCKKP